MTIYPTGGEYFEAIQDPGHCFTVPDLQAGEAVVNPSSGLPEVQSGQFAYVFKLRLETGYLTAVRCFARSVPDTQQRYQRISEHLTRVHVTLLTHFEYEPRGIRVRGNLYPMVQMDWVSGSRLNRFVGQNLENQAAIWQLAARWLNLVQQLESQNVVHGDLQHGNILITENAQIRLVDYDGMWVPGMEALGAAELGHRNYQHPDRSMNDFGPGLDRFSALVIYTALLALVERPQLWSQYESGDNFMFDAQDFKSPADSVLFEELLRLGGPAGTYARHLYHYCGQPIRSIPRLGILSTIPTPPIGVKPVAKSRAPDWIDSSPRGPSTYDSFVRSGSNPAARPKEKPQPAATSTPAPSRATSHVTPSTPVTAKRRSFIYVRAITIHLIGWLPAAALIAYLTGLNLALLVVAGAAIGLVTGFRSGRRKAGELQRRSPATQATSAMTAPSGASPRAAPSPLSGVTTRSPQQQTPHVRPGAAAAQYSSGRPARFVASTIRSRYHRPSCEWAQKIAPANRRTFNSEAEARMHNYRPCRVCVP